MLIIIYPIIRVFLSLEIRKNRRALGAQLNWQVPEPISYQLSSGMAPSGEMIAIVKRTRPCAQADCQDVGRSVYHETFISLGNQASAETIAERFHTIADIITQLQVDADTDYQREMTARGFADEDLHARSAQLQVRLEDTLAQRHSNIWRDADLECRIEP